MKASEVNFLQFLQGTKQFIIPIYQRTYSWNIKQCQQLWDDILRVAENDTLPAHFIGSIVYIQQNLYSVSSVPELLVIDGQQRLTTLSLLLCAMRDTMKDDLGSITQQKINNYYLRNAEEQGELSYKLHLTKSDHEISKVIINKQDITTNESPRLFENYKFFLDQMQQMTISQEQLFQGLQKLVIVDISLDRTHDNPQLIFESLNSTGLELSQADLIRNYILMSMEPKLQNEIYEEYWYKMEQDFGQKGYTERFDDFMRDYLTMKSPTRTIPRIDEVYEEFKKHFIRSEQAMTDIVKDIARFSKAYVKMVFDKETDDDLRAAFSDIATLRVDVAYPLLLEMYDDYTQERLSKADFLSLVRAIENYVFRRAIGGIPTNSLNKTFATFTRFIDKEHYTESFLAHLLLQDSYRRFPKDEEFKQDFIIRDVYNFRNRSYLFNKLENFDRKERVKIDDYTIEHIMPQNENLSVTWQEELGSNWQYVQEKYLHTIGNLTLTGYNPELSDRPFQEKRTMKGGFADSPIRLNRELASLEHWNEEEINKRAVSLAEVAARIWTYPDIDASVLNTYKKEDLQEEAKGYTLEIHAEELQGEVLELFQILRRRILNLGPSVKEMIFKPYIAYKTSTNFADIKFRKDRLLIILNMEYADLKDPFSLARDVTNIGHRGNGDIEISFSHPSEIDKVMELIQQSYAKYSEEE